MRKDKRELFFNVVLPKIIKLALRLPELIPSAIPLLNRSTSTKSISLSQQQIASLLANAFLCTFPTTKHIKGANNNVEKATYSEMNFSNLFRLNGRHVREKIKCICGYLAMVCSTSEF